MNPTFRNLSIKMLVPALTFFDENLGIDWSANENYARRLSMFPIQGVLLFGSTGEGASLSISERQRLIEVYVASLHVNQKIFIVIGHSAVGDERTLLDIRNNRINGYVLLPNFANKRIDPIDVRRLSWLSKHIDPTKRIYLYSLQKTTGISFANSHALSEFWDAGVAIDGLKISHEEVQVLEDLRALRTWRDEPIELWWGSDRYLRKSLEFGASAIVSSMLACYQDEDQMFNDQLLSMNLENLRETIGKGAMKLSRMKQRISTLIGGDNIVRPPYITC